jgi:hypothetical protein
MLSIRAPRAVSNGGIPHHRHAVPRMVTGVICTERRATGTERTAEIIVRAVVVHVGTQIAAGACRAANSIAGAAGGAVAWEATMSTLAVCAGQRLHVRGRRQGQGQAWARVRLKPGPATGSCIRVHLEHGSGFNADESARGQRPSRWGQSKCNIDAYGLAWNAQHSYTCSLS